MRDRTCTSKFVFAKSDANTGYEAKKLDKNNWWDDMMLINDPNHNFSDLSKTTNENTSQLCVHTVFESVLDFSHW